MDVISTFGILTGIIFIGYFAELLFKKTRIPDVVLLIAVGLILRYGLGWVNPADFGGGASLFATFTLVYLLFQGAMALDFKTLFSSLRPAASLTTLSFIITVIVVSVCGYFFFGFEIQQALLLGMILGGTSSAVVIPLVNMLPLNKKHGSTLIVESAISDVLSIIGALTMMNIIVTGQASGAGVLNSILTSFSMALVVGTIAGLVWINLLSRSKELRQAYMVTIAVVIGVYALIEGPIIHASGAIGALAFGIILGNSKALLNMMRRKRLKAEETELSSVVSNVAKSFYQEISFFVKVFFFVYLGILMEFTNLPVFFLSLVIVLLVFFARPIAVRLAYRKQKLKIIDRTNIEILIPKGLAAAVLVQLTIQAGVPGASELTLPVLGVILWSIIVTSILVLLSGRKKFSGFWSIFSANKQK